MFIALSLPEFASIALTLQHQNLLTQRSDEAIIYIDNFLKYAFISIAKSTAIFGFGFIYVSECLELLYGDLV
jgi:hypothetical protein